MQKSIIVHSVWGLLLLLTAWQAQAQERLSPLQQMEFYRAQIDSAQRERNASKTASVYEKMVTICRESPVFEHELPENLFLYGMWSTYAGNHQTAVSVLVELLDMPGNTDDTALLTLKARANNTLGTTYFFLKQWDNALIQFQKARDMATELQNNLGISIAENNIGDIYQKKGNYAQAIEHYLRCLQLQETINDRETICNTYYNMATCYSETGNFTESLYYFDLALNLVKETGDKEIEALCLMGLAGYHAHEKRQFSEAVKLVNQAELIAKETGHHQVLAEVYQARSAIDKERGDLASALEYYTQYKALSDILFNEQSTNQLHEYEVRYQTQEKQLEIEWQQAKAEKNMQYAAGLGVIVLLLIALAIVLLVNNRKIRRKNIAIARQILENTRSATVAKAPRNHEKANGNENGNENGLFAKIESYLLTTKLYLNENIDRKTLAGHTVSGEKRVENAIKESTGMTVGEYINSLRLAHACALLSDPANSSNMETIAFGSGFNNRTSFHRCFKAKYDMSPSEFRDLAKK